MSDASCRTLFEFCHLSAAFAETVVAESVVVIKKLLQTQPTQHGDIIKLMAKLFDNITVRFCRNPLVIFFHCLNPRRLTRVDFFSLPFPVVVRHQHTHHHPPRPQVPMARASILWLMGEYCERVPKIAPDVLRKMAKTFTAEEDIVKLQTVNLAAKLYLTNSKQVQDHVRRPVVEFFFSFFFLKFKIITRSIKIFNDVRDAARSVIGFLSARSQSG